MTGLWLASYLVLWGLIVVLRLLLIGILRQIGLMYRHLESRHSQLQGDTPIAAVEHDGPTIGEPMVHLESESINGFETLLTAMHDRGSTLQVFMSSMCETCQHIVDPLKALAAEAARAVQVAIIMRVDEQACRAFLSVFPLYMPVVCDRDRPITMGLDMRHTSFGLLFDEHGTLIRKGLLEGQEDLLALLGDRSAPFRAQAHVFPPVVSLLNA